MGEVVFIGLGLYDEEDITLKGLREARSCDLLFAEFYTSALMGTNIDKLEKNIGKKIKILKREEVEKGDVLFEEAKSRKVGFLVPGDPMQATTHIELRLRAIDLGIKTRIIHGTSIITAASGLLGLQAYKFGRIITIPFKEKGYHPISPYQNLLSNRKAGLHTLILLDVKEEGRYMTANEGIEYLLDLEKREGGKVFTENTILCALARVGSSGPLIKAGKAGNLVKEDFGKPLHCLVVPGKLHFMEKEALIKIAKAPQSIE